MKLAAETRTVFGKQVAALRKAGKVPGEVYGTGSENMHVAVEGRALAKAIAETGHTGIIMLGIEGKEARVIAHDWTVSSHTGELTHVDFKTVKAGERVEASVPVVFVGEAPAVKDGLGTLVKNLQEIDMEGLPERMPHEVEVDISGLTELHATIHISDLKFPTGIEVQTPADAVIATIGEIEEEEVVNDIAVEDVVVEGEKKEEAAS